MSLSHQHKGSPPLRDHPSFEADMPSIRVLRQADLAFVRSEEARWARRVDSGELKNVSRSDEGLILPIPGNVHADRVLFMLTSAQEHVFARCIGSEDSKYASNLIHGVMGAGVIRFDGEPLFHDGVAREDPRAMFIGGKIYLTYNRLDSNVSGDFSVGLSIIDDPKNPSKIRELGSLIKINEPGLDCKDSALVSEKIRGKHYLLIRLKPGIQAVPFNSMSDILRLATDPGYRDQFWGDFRRKYRENPELFNHLHPNAPEMLVWEARWKTVFQRQLKELISSYPETDYFRLDLDSPHWYGTGPTPLKVEYDGHKYWLGLPHRGQVIGTLTAEGVRKRTHEGRRLEDLKFYCILGTLHEYDDPRKLVAVSPLPLLMPSGKRVAERGIQAGIDPVMGSFAVPFTYITAGLIREEKVGGAQLTVPVGVNDMYTVIKKFDEGELLRWMMSEGKV
jgi:hypothetical protein